MARKKKKESLDRRSGVSQVPLAPQSPGYRLLERGLQVLTLGLVVAAPLVPEGSAEQFSNWMIFLLWLVACAGYAGLALLRREERLKAGAVDFCVYGVCLWAMVSGLVSFLNATGHARTTINATWQWLGYAAAFFVIRQLGRQRVFRTVLIWGLGGGLWPSPMGVPPPVGGREPAP